MQEVGTEPKFILKIILKYKIKSMVKIWRKRSKNSKQRFYKLKQWSDTEKSYLQKLVLLRDQVKKPLLESKLISQYEEAIIFPNLQSMIQLGQEMQIKINNLISSWNPITTVLAPTVESLVNYLKIYKEYSNNFNKADKIIQQLKHHPDYNNVIKIFNVQDYLIKPVQRPLQYKLFITDYIKLLPPQHKDKERLCKAKDTLLKIADEINQFVEKQIRAQKMIDLENSFGNLIQSTREYRSQFSAIHTEFNCRVYVFNDLLLIVKVINEGKQEKFMYLYLCGASYVIRQPDNKTFKNRLYICGSYESIHLTFRCVEDANIASHTIEQLINTLYKKQCVRTELLSNLKLKKQTMAMNRHSVNNQYKWKEQYDYRMKLRVQVVGVEKRLYEKEWKIVYAVKIQLGKPEDIYHVVFYQIEDLKYIERYLKEVFPTLNAPSLDTKLRGMTYEDVKADFTKYYEYKCILIEDFLNYILRSKVLSKRPEFVALKLRLYEGLWDYINKFSSECMCESCAGFVQPNNMSVYREQQTKIRKKQSQFCIINSFRYQKMLAEMMAPSQFKKLSLQQKLIWVTCKQNRINYSLQNPGHFGKKLGFHVYMKLIGEESSLFIQNITDNDTCRQVVEEFCVRKGITENMDFCLVYVHGKHEYLLDPDEYVYNAVAHLEGELKKLESDKRLSNTARSSIFNTFSRSMDDYGDAFHDYSVSDNPKLYVRKYFYLHSHLEEKACQKNPQRFSPVLAEYLRKFQEQYLLLSVEEIKQFCAMYYGLEQFNTIIFSKNIFCNQQKLKKFLPQSKWNYIGTEFTEKVREILERQVKPCSNIIILYRSVLKKFADKIGVYTQYFASESLDPAALGVKQKNLLIGVNHNKVTVSRRFNAGCVMDFMINRFQYRTSGDCLFIDSQDKTYAFRGNSWVFFEDLVEKYRLIFEMQWSETKHDK